MNDLDCEPITLKCGIQIYRACFSNKQAMHWYTTDYPNINGSSGKAFRVDDPRQAHTYTYGQLRLLAEVNKVFGRGNIKTLGV